MPDCWAPAVLLLVTNFQTGDIRMAWRTRMDLIELSVCSPVNGLPVRAALRSTGVLIGVDGLDPRPTLPIACQDG